MTERPPTHDLIVTGIGEVMTCAPLARENRGHGIAPTDLGILNKAWLHLYKGRIADIGTGVAPEIPGASVLDVHGGLVLPGLVDAHTHLLFGGSRAGEFWQRLEGATYQEIAAAGGGIRHTVEGSRTANDAELVAGVLKRLERMAHRGVTTVETKSGYGLSVAEEYRHLRLLAQASQLNPTTLVVTCLALHAASPEHPDLPSYIADVVAELLPRVASENLAQWVDAFVEDGYYSVDQIESYVETAKSLGLGVRLHADEFSDAGGAAAAARWGAVSADHLQCASEAGIAAMGDAGVTAIVLPGTSLYTSIPFTQGRRFADAGCPVAVATDFNPGSCLVDNLPMLAGLAALRGGLSPAEALAGVTYVPARTLGLGESKGALLAGFDGDLVIYEGMKSVADWLYDFGGTRPDRVLVNGEELALPR